MAKGKTAKGVKLRIGPVRFSYANVHEAKQINNQGDPKFSCTALIPKLDTKQVAEVEKAINEAYAEGVATLWGGKVDTRKIPNFKWAIHDGELEKPDIPEYDGMMFVNASNKQRPGILVRSEGNNHPLTNLEDFYSGCWGYMTVSFFAFDNISKGVGCSLQNILKTKDGEKLTARASADEDFRDFVEEGSDMM